MLVYRIVDRLALVLALTICILFLTKHEFETALFALALWPITRVVISVMDVFVLFLTEKPLVRGPGYHSNSHGARVHRTVE